MNFNCPSCQTRLEADPHQVGEELPCPACNTLLFVPRKAPMVLRKPVNKVRLVPIAPASRQYRKGSLAERIAAMRATQPLPEEQPVASEGPMLL